MQMYLPAQLRNLSPVYQQMLRTFLQQVNHNLSEACSNPVEGKVKLGPMQNIRHFEGKTLKLDRMNSERHQPQESVRVRIERLNHLATDIIATADELESLVSPIEVTNTGGPVDFYPLVRDFQVRLIQRALRRTGGSQIKAANLLNMKLTTLNSKIKAYEIQIKKNRFQPRDSQDKQIR